MQHLFKTAFIHSPVAVFQSLSSDCCWHISEQPITYSWTPRLTETDLLIVLPLYYPQTRQVCAVTSSEQRRWPLAPLPDRHSPLIGRQPRNIPPEYAPIAALPPSAANERTQTCGAISPPDPHYRSPFQSHSAAATTARTTHHHGGRRHSASPESWVRAGEGEAIAGSRRSS